MAPNVIMAMISVTRNNSRRTPIDDFALNPGNLVYICISAILVGGFVFSYPFITVIGRLLCKFNPVIALFTDFILRTPLGAGVTRDFRIPEITTRLMMDIQHDMGQGWRVRVKIVPSEGPDRLDPF
jgi:hypothetical protein